MKNDFSSVGQVPKTINKTKGDYERKSRGRVQNIFKRKTMHFRQKQDSWDRRTFL